MNFKKYNTHLTILLEKTFNKVISDNIRPQLAAEVINIFRKYPESPLIHHITERLENKDNKVSQKFQVKKIDKIRAYDLDPVVYKLLMGIKAGDVGPGEVLLALLGGTWEGGADGDYDIVLPNIGKVEVKYLGPFAHSTNVPTGSSQNKTIDQTKFKEFVKGFGVYLKENLDKVKGLLNPEEIDYLITNTFDQLFLNEENLSTNSLRIIGRLLRNAEKNGQKDFSSHGFSFSKYKTYMEEVIQKAVGNAPYIMFLGEWIEPTDDISTSGKVHENVYYIMPKKDLKYFMFYRVYKKNRIKIAPFSTEKEFFEKSINN